MWRRLIAGVLLVVTGAVWITQGIGVLHGSFMTGQSRWTAIGIVTAVAGLALIGWGLTIRRNFGKPEST